MANPGGPGAGSANAPGTASARDHVLVMASSGGCGQSETLLPGQWMRHFKSQRNAFLKQIGQTHLLLYFPDINESHWRRRTAFQEVPGLHMPEEASWFAGDGNSDAGYIWWIDKDGQRWKIGSRGNPVFLG